MSTTKSDVDNRKEMNLLQKKIQASAARIICVICLIASLHILFACNDNAAKTYSDEEKAKTDSVVIASRNIDSLTVLAERFKKGGDGYGEIAAYR